MPVSASLRGRVPGQVAIRDFVTAQALVHPVSLASRHLGRSPLTPATRELYRAALGEVVVGEMLDQLGPQWDVLHVVPVADDEYDPTDGFLSGDSSCESSSRQIDHLVIGPPGVFAVITENFPGQEVRVNGESMIIGSESVDDIAITRRLAAKAAERLTSAAGRSVRVEPVIVVVGSTKLRVREQPLEVTIVDSKHLIALLTRLERSLAGSQVAFISDVADRDSTWEAAPIRPEEALRLDQEFATLRAQVRESTQARIFWGAFGFFLLASTIWIGTAMVAEKLLGH